MKFNDLKEDMGGYNVKGIQTASLPEKPEEAEKQYRRIVQ
jgi:hypothetical protein